LGVEGANNKAQEGDHYISITLAILGCLGVSYLIYQRRIE